MTDNFPIITNHALEKMKAWGLSESAVLDAFNKGSKSVSITTAIKVEDM